MTLQVLSHAFTSFLAQPWGVVGALCIMFAVTAFNSNGLKAWLGRLGLGEAGMALLLNGFNLVGGICLFVNAMKRDEAVWIVLEIYFVTVAVKGLWQSSSALRRFFHRERAVAIPTPEQSSGSVAAGG